MRIANIAAAAAGIILSACQSVPLPPANAAPAMSMAERAGTPGVAHSNVIEAVGAPVLATEPVSRGGVLMRFAYRYKHTAVLTEDVVGFSVTVSGVQASAGSPGYYAGTFTSSLSPGVPQDLWCFLPSVVGGRREHLCLLRTGGLAAIAPTRMNPYLWTDFSPATGTFDYVRAPIFERRDVAIPGDLSIEYRFQSWSRTSVRLSEYAVGREVRDFEIYRAADGSADLHTVAGNLTISPAGEGATASLAPTP